MKVEDPNALRFILQDDIYLLEEDKFNCNQPDNQPEPVPEPLIKTEKVNFNYLGVNKKNFLILVHYPGHEFMADDHLSALESVLNRIGHTRDDVAVFNTAKNTAEHEPLRTYFNPKTILILGKEALVTGMDQPEFNLIKKLAGLTVLYTFSFDTMMNDTANKKAFWEQVKTL